MTVGPEVTEVITALEQEGEFAEQLFTHGLGVQSAEGTAEWLHSRVRAELGIGPTEGRRYSWGYPACPEQSEHEKIYRLLDCPSIGLSLTGGFAVEPEQSTLAIVAHHPQAVYFGMKSGFLPKDKAPDDIIAGSDRDATLRRGDADPREGPPEDEPALVGDARAERARTLPYAGSRASSRSRSRWITRIVVRPSRPSLRRPRIASRSTPMSSRRSSL